MPSTDSASLHRRPPLVRPGSAAGSIRPALDASRPATPHDMVRRPKLIAELAGGTDGTVAMLVAPPGYGKTTLLRQWAARDKRQFVWLELGGDDARGVTVLPELVRDARKRLGRFVVILDDADRMAPRTLGRAVLAALPELPAKSAIVISSRTEPALPAGKLRAHRQLTEVRTPQLTMSASEALTLLRQCGVDPDFESVRMLLAATEGWPAALYLAALAVREDPGGLEEFGGRHHLVSDYLRDDVLAGLTGPLASFARQTSVLDELSSAACNSVLKVGDGGERLSQLARRTALLLPVDSAHHRYRWHRLMREMLVAELERLEPERERVLRIRASRWHASRGETRQAIGQAAAARHARLTGELLWPELVGELTCGHQTAVRDWLESFTADELARHASLALSSSLSALLAGDVDTAQQLSLTAAGALSREARRPRPDSRETGLAIVEALIGRDGLSAAAGSVRRAAQIEPPDSPWRGLCLLLEGVSTHLAGDREEATLLLEEAVSLSVSVAPAAAALALAQRSMIAIERQEWESAVEQADRAMAIVSGRDLQDDPLLAVVFAVAAASRAHEGRVDEAKQDLRHGIGLMATLGDFVAWYAAETRILLAHASLWLADVLGARTLLAEASRYARRVTDAVIFEEWFDQAWGYMDTMAETSLAGPSSLTIAELRILRFLPSHRSFREIAAQLGVSANTVKTQAHAVYRKLGAASRSEAVTQARVAGLLGQ